MLQTFNSGTSFLDNVKLMKARLSHTPELMTGEWQSQRVDHPLQSVHELHNVILEVDLSSIYNLEDLQKIFEPNIPWADEHFEERVSGFPHNPPPSHVNWPYAQRVNDTHRDETGRFSHSYPERFWPKKAGLRASTLDYPNQGINGPYGDLDDVIALLSRSPYTRQAYLPVWFPEDTGNNQRVRVPCTLGYHFQIRREFSTDSNTLLNCTYMIRSCDLYRHLNDDVYMAARLMVHVAQQVNYLANVDTYVGRLVVHIMNLHVFAGDMPRLRGEL